MPFEITLDWRSLRSIGASANLCLADPLVWRHGTPQRKPAHVSAQCTSDVLWCAEEFWRWVGVGVLCKWCRELVVDIGSEWVGTLKSGYCNVNVMHSVKESRHTLCK